MGCFDGNTPCSRIAGRPQGSIKHVGSVSFLKSDAFHACHYNFLRIHKTHRVTPAMATGLSQTVMDWADIVEAMDADTPTKKTGSLQKGHMMRTMSHRRN
jgi:hypothetical protein